MSNNFWNHNYPAEDIKQDEYEKLAKWMQKQAYLYYVLSDIQIPDAEYDRQYRRLQKIESLHPEWIIKNSPTQYVDYDRSLGLPEGVEE